MTLQQAAQSALDVQNASNLPGILRSFVTVTDTLRANGVTGNIALNEHPICLLYAVQVAHLTNLGTGYDEAYAACEKLAKGDA